MRHYIVQISNKMSYFDILKETPSYQRRIPEEKIHDTRWNSAAHLFTKVHQSDSKSYYDYWWVEYPILVFLDSSDIRDIVTRHIGKDLQQDTYYPVTEDFLKEVTRFGHFDDYFDQEHPKIDETFYISRW